MIKIKIETEYIQLQQFLKLISLVSSGGEAKEVISTGIIKVNDQIETRRGKKLYPGDKVFILDIGTYIVE